MYHNWSAIEENVLLGVPNVVGWLVWMGLMSAFQLRCEILEKTNTFLILLAFFAEVNECSFPKFMSFVVGFWRFSGPRKQRIMALPKFVYFWVGFLAFLWPKVWKNHGVSEIRVFLGLIFGISLAQSAEELWHSQNLCLSASRNA